MVLILGLLSISTSSTALDAGEGPAAGLAGQIRGMCGFPQLLLQPIGLPGPVLQALPYIAELFQD